MSVKDVIILVLSTILLSILILRISGIRANLTDSEPEGLYIAIPGTPQDGDIIELRPMIKHVAGSPGDTVDVTPLGTYINDELWPYSALPTDTPYLPFPMGTYTLGPNQYWLIGDSPDSWDSRYIGPVPASLIASRLKPLITNAED